MSFFEVSAPVMRGASEPAAAHAASARLHALQPDTSADTQNDTEQRSIDTLPASSQELRVAGLSVTYETTPVLQELNFSLAAGQRMVIQGLSGSGKKIGRASCRTREERDSGSGA